VIAISHDREFLDRIAETTWHVADGSIKRYAGNYSAFEGAWLEQQRQQDAAARSYARTAAHLQSYVDRFRAQATKARQAQSRLKMLERLTVVEPVRARREWRFEFLEPVRVPELSANAQAGRRAFDLYCARCHGEHAAGGPAGPPLIHRTYGPAHHADIAFELAVRRGVRAHHARFGDMPPQPAVTADEVVQITRYVRELQRANGID
jgi:mono/diheme cytochrome c family protein